MSTEVSTVPMVRANISWLTDDLATGGDLSFDPDIAAEQVLDIVDSGITHIIDMRKEDNDSAIWEREGVKYLHLPADDSRGYHVPHSIFDAAVEFARQAEMEDGKVLAHCHMGINRGPSCAMAILMDKGHRPSQAWDLIRAKRPIAAIAYAEDALLAHLERIGSSPVRRRLHHDLLLSHITSRMTPEIIQGINHSIRENHLNDKAVLERLQQRGR